MILGVDHVALSCGDLAAAVGRLEGAGFRTRFIERDVPNRPAKRPFLRDYRPRHDLAYCESPAGVAVELTRHGPSPGDGQGPYRVLFSGAVPGEPPPSGEARFEAEAWQAGLGVRPEARCWPEVPATFWTDAARSAPAAIRAVLLPVADLTAALRFWQEGMGCRVSASGTMSAGRGWARLHLAAPVASWSLEILLGQDDRPPAACRLDAAGFPCLAFLSTGVERDAERLQESGGVLWTGAFDLQVGGKGLKIGLLCGPAGEMVELIEVRRDVAARPEGGTKHV